MVPNTLQVRRKLASEDAHAAKIEIPIVVPPDLQASAAIRIWRSGGAAQLFRSNYGEDSDLTERILMREPAGARNSRTILKTQRILKM